jgi:hypothetical protein
MYVQEMVFVCHQIIFLNLNWFGNDCFVTKCYNINSNETNVCSGNGKCISPNNCTCISNYNSTDCFLSNKNDLGIIIGSIIGGILIFIIILILFCIYYFYFWLFIYFNIKK